MRKINFLHPVAVFIASLLALGVSLYLYIDSYIRVNNSLHRFIKTSGLPKGQFKEPQTWMMILVLSILVALIVLGMTLVFVYYQKVIQLYRMQQNFINGFTHELKTPLASLKIFIDTLLKHDLEKDKRDEYLGLMKIDTDRLKENVESILNLAKIEDKSFRPEYSEVDIHRSLNEFVRKHKHLFSDGVINIGPLEDRTFIWFDNKLLEIVFMNILTNALRYNDKQEKIVDVYFKRVQHGIEVIFKDNGNGIKREHLKSVFKKFYQVGKSAKGSGLGLYMVWQIMRLHRSKVWATSEGSELGTSIHLLFTTKDNG